MYSYMYMYEYYGELRPSRPPLHHKPQVTCVGAHLCTSTTVRTLLVFGIDYCYGTVRLVWTALHWTSGPCAVSDGILN